MNIHFSSLCLNKEIRICLKVCLLIEVLTDDLLSLQQFFVYILLFHVRFFCL